MPIRNMRVDWSEKLECKSGSRLKIEFEELSGYTYKVVDRSKGKEASAALGLAWAHPGQQGEASDDHDSRSG